MGVKYLWDILEPTEHKIDFKNLKEKWLAVDLSGWVCESLNVNALKDAKNPHLRNLFYRIMHLKLLGINLLFVTEGKAPLIKNMTILKRCSDRSTNSNNSNLPASMKPLGEDPIQRKKFKLKLRECEEMLSLLGIPCLTASGEAEALCATLNKFGIVDGCLTNDSDIFLYGATTVYRNFSVEKSSEVKMYSMIEVEEKLNLNRNKLISLALLLGCDYCGGLPGIGKEKAMKFLNKIPVGENVLNIFRHWKSNCTFNEEDKDIEIVRQKFCKITDYIPEKIIAEFLNSNNENNCHRQDFNWKIPQRVEFKSFCEKKLEWPIDHSETKIVPLCTRWLLEHINKDKKSCSKLNLNPLRIIKFKTKRGQLMAEVEWILEDENNVPRLFIVDESRELFSEAFPNMFCEFTKNTKTRVKKKTKDKGSNSLGVISEVPKSEGSLKNYFESRPLNCIQNTCAVDKLKTPETLACKADALNINEKEVNQVKCIFNSGKENQFKYTFKSINKGNLIKQPISSSSVKNKTVKDQISPEVITIDSSDDEFACSLKLGKSKNNQNQAKHIMKEKKYTNEINDNVNETSLLMDNLSINENILPLSQRLKCNMDDNQFGKAMKFALGEK